MAMIERVYLSIPLEVKAVGHGRLVFFALDFPASFL